MERIATVNRETKETQIHLTLNLDGSGKCTVKNPIGFFNHMLNSFCKHGLFDLSGSIAGDLDVDQHHLIEDTGIALGQAFAMALGDCAGIKRAGYFIYPMDESLLRCGVDFTTIEKDSTQERKQATSQVAVDFGGRPFCVCNAKLTGIPLVSVNEKGVQELFQTDCFEDFWQGFSANAKCNIHLDTIRGRSDHHKIEGLFKAAARALREAVSIDPRRNGEIPSTKGKI
ncbi:imidazoleglycerol-phosphate dehydratase [Treponema pectinovorum]|uniref:imidazoleglycerol-phosphate dehydratase n=1 Tax=Treponema pectinovorum TaxID=164 RepID=UPI0011C80C3A|nr:imidazoleglycerol-phosphate dehydratase [Treponema pectinovorum]